MSLHIQDADEAGGQPNELKVNCDNATWKWRFKNGFMVEMRGALVACWAIRGKDRSVEQHFEPRTPRDKETNFVLKLQHLRFDSDYHEKYFSTSSVACDRDPEPMLPPAMPAPRVRGPNPYQDSIQRRQADDRAFQESNKRVIFHQAILPTEPVNHFGVPQGTMRCLEVSAIVCQSALWIRTTHCC
jgi:hypothetical protein